MKLKAQKGKIRLDKFLSSKIVDKSRSFIQKLIKDGKVMVNEKRVSSGYTLREKDIVDVDIVEEKRGLKSEKGKIDIVHEDVDVLVVEKPKDMLVHPKEGEKSGSLINSFLEKIDMVNEDDERPGVVHRLDRDTTGLLVIAKNDKSFKSLKSQFKKREIEKRYLALVYGHIEPKNGEINIPIRRDAKNRTKRQVSEEGKEALTKYEVVEYIEHDGVEYTLLEAMLVTGRTHQIRLHFKAIGHPVVGDKDYTAKNFLVLNKKVGLERQFLHAYKLGFYHPRTKKWIGFKSDLPEDLSRVLKGLRSESGE